MKRNIPEMLPEAVNTKETYLITKNNELNNLNLSIEKKQSLVLDKTKFVDRLESKINKLSNKTVLTQMKYSYYKWWYDILNIFIIFISSALTIIESIKNEINYEEQNNDIKYFFKLSPIIVSTIIVIVSSILKFLRLQENLEIMARTTEKSILTIYRMKKVQEECYFASQEELDSIQSTYLDEIFIMYNQCQGELSKCFKYNDLITYSNEKEKIILKGKKDKYRIHKRFKSKQASSIDMDTPVNDIHRNGSFNPEDLTSPMTPVGSVMMSRRRNPSVEGDFDLESIVFNMERDDSVDGTQENKDTVTNV